MIKQFTEEELLGRPRSAEQEFEIAALIAMPDSDIDFSDIPEIRELPANAVRGLLHRGPVIRLSDDLRAHFADLASRNHQPMNDLVNETLRRAVAAELR